MCNQSMQLSTTTTTHHREEYENNKRNKLPSSVLDSLLFLRYQWLSWLFIPDLHTIPERFLKRNGCTTSKLLKQPYALKSLLACLIVFYVGIPVWFYLCPWIRRTSVFLHFADWPFQTLSHPEYYGLSSTRHFFVTTSPGVALGVWHILPQNYNASYEKTLLPNFNDDRPIVLYLHGSAESRSAAYRRSMYKVLSNEPLNAHVITFDYRGFGDSTYVSPTAQTVEEDSVAMYNWLQKHVPKSRIILWGHSMGTGIAARMGDKLAKEDNNPLAIVLEAPFTSIAAATKTFPLSFFHRHLPFFEHFCSERTKHPDTNLNSEERIGGITAPLLILHAADDSMVWSEQGKTLWKIATDSRSQDLHRPMFVELDGKYGCGHRNIHKAPNLPFEVKRFLESVSNYIMERSIIS